MNRSVSTRIWTIVGIGIAAIAGLGLLLAFLGREPTEPPLAITTAVPPQSDEPIAASVDGRAISQSSWAEAVLLDQVLSGLAGQPAPTPDETLWRLIDQELVLQATSEQELLVEQVEVRIAALQQTWGVDEYAVTAALEGAGLTRAVFEQAMKRLLKVEAGLAILGDQGYDTAVWLEEQRASAEIQVFQDATPLPVSTAPATTIVTATETPSLTAPLAGLGTAPDFTLERAGGGALTLTEQLTKGPVVLVFFQKCG